MAYEKKTYKKPWNGKINHSSSIDHHSSRMKRGPLSSLMTEVQKKSANIQDLSYDFACRITRLFQYLTEDSNYKEHIISKQVYRSGTSIGSNAMEAQHAQSDADFLSKMQISLKECNETDYWLKLLHDNGYLNDVQYTSLETDRVRIHKLLNKIVHTTRTKIGK